MAKQAGRLRKLRRSILRFIRPSKAAAGGFEAFKGCPKRAT